MRRVLDISLSRGRWLACVLSLLLAVELGAAFAPSAGANGLAIEICTSDGVATLVIDPDTGKPVPQHSPHDHCPLCVLPAAFLAPPPSMDRVPAVFAIALRWSGPVIAAPAPLGAVPAIRAPPASA